jgi:hypothetical protein
MNSIGSYSERGFCPRCRERLRIEDVRVFSIRKCPACESLLAVSSLYRGTTLLLCLVASLLLAGRFHVKAYAAVVWIPLLFVSLAQVPNLAKFLLPPRLMVVSADAVSRSEEPWRRHLRLFFAFWFGGTLYSLAYGFVLGWGTFLIGGSKRDIQEIADFHSVPLGWVNSRFVITPTSGFPVVLGIILANCFFYAVMLTAITRFVQSRLRQPITRLGISFTPPDDSNDV